MRDYKTYVQIGIFIGYVANNFCGPPHNLLVFTHPCSGLIPIYAIALFTPTIINELGYSAANAQLLTVPPFAAGCFFTIFVGIYSDKCRLRGPVVIGCASVSLVGYIVLYTAKTAGAGYAGAVLAAVGVFPTIAVDLAWAGGNAGGDVKRGVVIAMVVGLGNLGGYGFLVTFTKINWLIHMAAYALRSYISTLPVFISAMEQCEYRHAILSC
jgi:hypothetical protein